MTETMTTEAYRATRGTKPATGRRGKYNNVPVEIGDEVFDSKGEAARWRELVLMQQAGEISNLRAHPVYELQPSFVDSQGSRVRAITWEADFEYIERGQLIAEDFKGHATEAWRLRAKMFQFRYRHIRLRVTRAR